VRLNPETQDLFNAILSRSLDPIFTHNHSDLCAFAGVQRVESRNSSCGCGHWFQRRIGDYRSAFGTSG